MKKETKLFLSLAVAIILLSYHNYNNFNLLEDILVTIVWYISLSYFISQLNK